MPHSSFGNYIYTMVALSMVSHLVNASENSGCIGPTPWQMSLKHKCSHVWHQLHCCIDNGDHRVQLLLQGFLLVFYSNHSHKMHRF